MFKIKELLFYGDDILTYDFSEEFDIIYPKKPIKVDKNAKEIVREALENPAGSIVLEDLIRSNSKVVIAFDDVSVPFPLPKQDPRRLMALEVVKKLKKAKIPRDSILFICATGLHRKCRKTELKQMLGEIATSYRVINHDCNDVLSLGETESGYKVEINKHAARADLIIYLSIPFLPMNGGWKSIAVGLGGYESIRQHHIPEVLREGSYMNPDSRMHGIINEIGGVIESHVNVFQIETVLNNDFYSGPFRFMWRKLEGRERMLQKLMLKMSNKMPHKLKSGIRKNYRASYGIIYSSAGHPDEIHPLVLEKVKEQNVVRVNRKYDAILFGLPNLSPYSIKSEMNPVLFHTVVRGYLCNMFYRIVKDGATFVVQNPLFEVFDRVQHPSYEFLYYNYLAKGKNSYKDLCDAEVELVNNSTLMKEYREGYAYHPAHSVIAYYWGSLGQEKIDEVIVSGAVGRTEIIGCKKAENMDEAVKILYEKGASRIAYAALPPVFIAE